MGIKREKEEVKSIVNPAGIGKGTGFGLRDRDRDGIGLGHYRLRANFCPYSYCSKTCAKEHRSHYYRVWAKNANKPR